MQPPRAPGGSDAEDIVRHREESRRLDKEPAMNRRRWEPGSMPSQKKEIDCEYRVATAPGQLNICTAGVYGGQVTDGMCRLCIKRGDRPKSVTLPRVAIGDAVEKMLTSIGITKERVQKWTRKGCGCSARQRWMNQWGFEKQEQIERVLRKAAKWYGIS